MSVMRNQLRSFYDDEAHDRATRPLGPDRQRCLSAFVEECVRRGVVSVLEVGCGAGRDGVLLREGGLMYVGIDLSPASVALCRERGLDARVGLATKLPFADDSFDAAWSMSTLMHLEGDEMPRALAELGRVVRPGGLLEVGVWGNETGVDWTDPSGRYFCHRTDAELLGLLSGYGRTDDFRIWGRRGDGVHYQWARMTIDKNPVN